jgi:3-methyladenine DNA glycosylase AlkD
MDMTAKDVMTALQAHARFAGAETPQFFPASPAQRGTGNLFIGVKVPLVREVCRRFKDLPRTELRKLLYSPVHDYRLAALILMNTQYGRATPDEARRLYELYMQALADGKINNWELVDVSAPYMLGQHLYRSDRTILFELARPDDACKRRAAMVATYYFLKQGDATTTIALAEQLLSDKRDLVQKAVGWMLREMGKRVERKLLLEFLDKYAAVMPRTALRYALEHLTPEQKRYYMDAAKNV